MEIYPFSEEDPGLQTSKSNLITNENAAWEYQLIVRDLELDNAPGEDELNPLGAEGWELIDLFVHANMLYCYFKAAEVDFYARLKRVG